MEGALESLPAWALFAIALVWLTFQFVQKFVERQGQKRDERARREYRERKGRATMVSLNGGPASVPKAQSRPSEDTGRHLRAVLEEERERERQVEIVANTRQHAEMMGRLVAAEGSQTMLLQRLVEMQERQDKMMQQIANTQQAIVQYLSSSGGHAATLRNLDAVVVREDGGG